MLLLLFEIIIGQKNNSIIARPLESKLRSTSRHKSFPVFCSFHSQKKRQSTTACEILIRMSVFSPRFSIALVCVDRIDYRQSDTRPEFINTIRAGRVRHQRRRTGKKVNVRNHFFHPIKVKSKKSWFTKSLRLLIESTAQLGQRRRAGQRSFVV